MRTFILFFFTAIALMSCDNTEINERALQVNLNNEFFKAVDSRAQLEPDGSFSIQGFTDLEILTIRLSNSTPGVYTLGGDSPNRIIFQDFENSVYTTNTYGSGQVTIEDASSGFFTGKFRFVGYRFGLDTLTAQNGLFYRVPLTSGLIDDNPIIDVNLLSAVIDGVNFNATTITGVDSGNFILISGTSGNTTISFSFPNTLTNGNNPIAGNISAMITINGVESDAITGNLSIVNHNTELNSISGAFSFNTASPDAISITQGQFNVDY